MGKVLGFDPKKRQKKKERPQPVLEYKPAYYYAFYALELWQKANPDEDWKPFLYREMTNQINKNPTISKLGKLVPPNSKERINRDALILLAALLENPPSPHTKERFLDYLMKTYNIHSEHANYNLLARMRYEVEWLETIQLTPITPNT